MGKRVKQVHEFSKVYDREAISFMERKGIPES